MLPGRVLTYTLPLSLKQFPKLGVFRLQSRDSVNAWALNANRCKTVKVIRSVSSNKAPVGGNRM